MTTTECTQYNAKHNDKKWPYIKGIGSKEPLYIHPQSFMQYSSTTEVFIIIYMYIMNSILNFLYIKNCLLQKKKYI